MSSPFIYFLETTPQRPGAPTLADLKAAGLGYLIDVVTKVAPTNVATSNGPGKKPGFLICMPAVGATCFPKYLPEQQTWEEGPDGAYWVGFTTADPPTPDDLVRKDRVPGHAIRLLDGKEWIVPVARSMAGRTTLPVQLVLGPDKKSWRPRTQKQYLGLCELADDCYKLFQSTADTPHPAARYAENGEMGYDFSYGMTFVLAALAVNYKLSSMEVSMLGLLGDDHMQTIMEAVIDWPAYVQMMTATNPGPDNEKKDPAPGSPSIDSGSGASSPNTSQPLAT